ncbi:MAG: hypothetical protein WBV21_03895 [Desulfobacterales bacterium]
MRRSLIQWFICAGFSSILTVSCAGTRMSQTWVDETWRGKPVSDVLVIVVADKAKNREAFEHKFVQQLKAAGVEAVSSADVIPMPRDLKLEKDVILQAVAKYGNDAVILSHLTGLDKKEVFTRTGPIYGGYYNYYGYTFDTVHDRGFYSEIATVRLETNLYDVKTEKLLWSGQSQSEDVQSINKLIDEVIALVIKDLQKNKLLPTKS